VLPFQNTSGDPDQEYFADGMVEDIITGLSRIKWLFVIARNSSFVYKGKAVDIRQVGRELGVRYVLEGGVRKASNRLRITGQLIEAETGAHLWADKFDGTLDDVFALQDQITDRVVGIVEPSVQRSEIKRSLQKRPESLDAEDLVWRAMPHLRKWRPVDCRVAIGFLEKVLELDPTHATAHACIAVCRANCFWYDGFEEAEKATALLHARIVIASATDHANALAQAAQVVALLDKDYDAASSAIDRTLTLNPSSAAAHYNGALIHSYHGNSPVAATHADRALRLSPLDPSARLAHSALGMSALREAKLDEAGAHFGRAVQVSSGVGHIHIYHAAALALAGRIEEGRSIARRGLELEPGWRIRALRELGLLPEISDKLIEGARLLGLPE